MNRIDETFAALRRAGRKGLVGYLTAGDPDPETSERNIRAALEHGVDVLELGVPYSDPTADGPTIQAASQRALAAGMTTAKSLELVKRLRRDFQTPIVLFGYANPFFRYGYARLCAEAAAAGVDGLLAVDLAFEEADELREHMAGHDLALIPLIAPTTPRERAAAILARAQGFVYYIMVTGVTGARAALAADMAAHVAALRGLTPLPVAVGFGISNGAQARRAAEAADAVVVGSALIQAAGAGRLPELVRALRDALTGTGTGGED
ncbi:MAG: tryptophan synthase subunit alpha [Lentisphaerae bacterium]|nr:tryptophan synthase subunit alpha [Lentisphaerota bacterium]